MILASKAVTAVADGITTVVFAILVGITAANDLPFAQHDYIDQPNNQPVCVTSRIGGTSVVSGSEFVTVPLAAQGNVMFESSMHARTDSSLRDMLSSQLAALRLLSDNWDGDGAIAPNEYSRSTAARILNEIMGSGSVPDEVDSDVMGGVAIMMHSDSLPRSAWFVMPNRGEPRVVLHGDDCPSPRSRYLTEGYMKDVIEFLRRA